MGTSNDESVGKIIKQTLENQQDDFQFYRILSCLIDRRGPAVFISIFIGLYQRSCIEKKKKR